MMQKVLSLKYIDLEYPEELHELYKDLPLCPEHFVPSMAKCTIPKTKFS